MSKASPCGDGFTVRTIPKPGDTDAITRLHGDVYAAEYGFDSTFEACVAGPLSEFVRTPGRRWGADLVEEKYELTF